MGRGLPWQRGKLVCPNTPCTVLGTIFEAVSCLCPSLDTHLGNVQPVALPVLWPNQTRMPQLLIVTSQNIGTITKTQKICMVGTTPPTKPNPMAWGLGWGHGHMVCTGQWQCFAYCMTCGAHGCVLWQPLCPMLGGPLCKNQQ